jgi:hypothetical protein
MLESEAGSSNTGESTEQDPTAAALHTVASALPDRINADPERVEQGLARLVLTVLEHQAVRRMEGGTLSEEEIERLGLTLLKLSRRMDELKAIFGLTDEDLNIDLGPLGRLR